MQNNIDSLYEFIASAERNRKYPSNTAMGYKNALNLVLPELNEEEKTSLDIFEANLNQIFNSIYNKNKNLSVGTLETYKKRIRLVISDFKKIGSDSTKMATWDRQVRSFKRNKIEKSNEEVTQGQVVLQSAPETRVPEIGSTMTRYELPLRPDAKAIILTPSDLTPEEVKKIKVYIESLEKLAELSVNINSDPF